MVEEVVISQTPDPRIRGVCPIREDDYTIPYPFIDFCASKKYKRNIILGSGFRVGSVVEYRNQARTVKYVNSYIVRPKCLNQHSWNLVTDLDLGGVIVSCHEVKLIKL